MTSQNPIVLDDDDEASDHHLYTGIQQLAAMGQTTGQGLTHSSSTSSVPEQLSTPEHNLSQNGQHHNASAHLDLSAAQPHPTDSSEAAANASQAPKRWKLPPQQVCKDGATPTAVCGRYSAALNDPPKPPVGRGGTGPFKCPRCKYGYSRIDSVRQHFPACVAVNGNPDCDSWTDDDSYAAGVAQRSVAKVKPGVVQKPRKPMSKASDLVHISLSEMVIRIATHEHLRFQGPKVETKEEEDTAWNKIVQNFKEETRNAGEIPSVTRETIKIFKMDGLWANKPSSEA